MRISLAAGILAFGWTGAVIAAPIGTTDFSNPAITSFGNPGDYATLGEPKVIGSYTFTSQTGGGLRWFPAGTGFADCVSGCITTNNSTALRVALDSTYALAGLYVGQAIPYSLDVSFYDSALLLLGTVNVASSAASGGVSFAGWESDVDRIASISINLPTADGYVIAAQSGYLQADPTAVPEPASLALLGLGLAGIAAARRRSAV